MNGWRGTYVTEIHLKMLGLKINVLLDISVQCVAPQRPQPNNSKSLFLKRKPIEWRFFFNMSTAYSLISTDYV